jgi:hypothetical protein
MNGNKTLANDHSSINAHEQSTAIGSENIERFRKMLFSKAELQPTPIVENKNIQKTFAIKFETRLLPFQLGKCKNLFSIRSKTFSDIVFGSGSKIPWAEIHVTLKITKHLTNISTLL